MLVSCIMDELHVLYNVQSQSVSLVCIFRYFGVDSVVLNTVDWQTGLEPPILIFVSKFTSLYMVLTRLLEIWKFLFLFFEY